MSGSESGDDMEELQSILHEYSAKENPFEKDKPVGNEIKEDKPTEWIRSEEEIRLDKLIFGDKEGLLENLKKSSGQIVEDSQPAKTKKRKPAWQDEEEYSDMGQVNKRSGKSLKEHLKSKFERVIKTPKWADLDRKEDIDSDGEILRSVGFISESKSAALPPRDIKLKGLQNLKSDNQGIINSIQFHPTSTVAMVSDLNCMATLYSIDGMRNDALHSIRFDKFPIYCSKILNCGTKAMFASNKNYYFSYDLMKATETRHSLPKRFIVSKFEVSPDGKYFAANGRFGELHLFDLKSKEFIHTFKQNETCRAFKFTLDSTKIIASSVGCSVNIFDIRQQRVMHTFLDDGCIQGRSMALSPDGRMLATGSSEGAVNIYEYQKVLASKSPQPVKTILNLTTSIYKLNFNHTSEILGMCSNVVSEAIKLVHFPTGTVFANFPGLNPKLGTVKGVEFSPSSGYMAVATTQKKGLLFRLEHFNNY